ncbi:MAG: hypothetical protein CL424_12865 [Acidimicrobiaceae bacterium]|nr:hypothetical protein [Acidimicrobiaceae bacterium]
MVVVLVVVELLVVVVVLVGGAVVVVVLVVVVAATVVLGSSHSTVVLVVLVDSSTTLVSGAEVSGTSVVVVDSTGAHSPSGVLSALAPAAVTPTKTVNAATEIAAVRPNNDRMAGHATPEISLGDSATTGFLRG